MEITSCLKRLIYNSLKEDIGKGDITSHAIFDTDFPVSACLIVKENAVLCGLDIFKAVFLYLSDRCHFSFSFNDGDFINANTVVGTVSCPIKAMMAGERTALNFLQHLSGIATLTKKFVEKAGSLEVYDTRKTTPLLRTLEKYAVKTGGGKNHRFGLYDMVLIKDNHISAYMQREKMKDRVEAMGPVVRKVVEKAKGRYRVEVEVENFMEAREAFTAGADIIMFDNAKIVELKKFMKFLGNQRGKIEIEWSGNVTLENISSLKSLPIDRISVGAVTHSAKAIDFSMKIKG